MDEARRIIQEALDEKGMTYADASRVIGANHAYIQQFMKRHVPDVLPAKKAALLAEALGLDPAVLGVQGVQSVARDVVAIREHDVRASAGHGTIVDGESVPDTWQLPRRYVRDGLSLRGGQLDIIEVIGDSMEPTLRSGDKIMVDLGDKNPPVPGAFALFDGDAVVVKRIEKVPQTPLIRIMSDNPRHGHYDVPAETVNIAGRVVWFGRRL